MITYPFTLAKPNSLSEATSLIAANPDAKLLAGGQTLIPAMKQRLASPSTLIDISGLRDLDFIHADTDAIVIGAMTKHADVASSKDIKNVLPALASLAEGIGDPAVRHMGTIGGSIANNDPAADYPAAALGLGAVIRTTKREIAADDFFTGMFETALDEDEIISEVSFPIADKAGYAKFPSPASRYAMVGAFVANTGANVRVAITGAGPCVFRIPELEIALTSNFTPDAIADISVPPDGLNSDLHGSSGYRAHLITVMTRRAVATALGR